MPSSTLASLLAVFLILSTTVAATTLGTHAQEQQGSADGTGEDKKILFGCTLYVPQYFCSPILNDFGSFAMLGDFEKVASATRQPDFVKAKDGMGIYMNNHALESLRVNDTAAYHAAAFSINVSFRANNSDPEFGNQFANLITYRNGIYRNDPHTAGWEIDFMPGNDTSKKVVRFSVFNSNGDEIHPEDVSVPADRFVDVTGTFDGSTVKLFVDGSLASQTPFVGNYTASPGDGVSMKFAGDAYCSCYLPAVTIDDIQFYNYPIADSEVAKTVSVMKKGDTPKTAGQNAVPVGHWMFEGNLADSSPAGNNAFLNTMIASMVFAPDGRLFYTEKNSGNIRIMKDGVVQDKPFAKIPNIYVDWEQGLLGITLDSKFGQNHHVYVYHNYKDPSSGSIFSRVLRFTDANGTGTEVKTLIDKIPASKGFHTGGALAFNNADDKLYITVGDAISRYQAQNISSPNGKVLRITRDGTIPEDNPFPGSPVFTYGHRNMYGIAFDNQGNGIVTEPGASLYDEVNYLKAGENYGWPTLQLPDTAPEIFTNNTSIKPIRSYWQTSNPTQAIYYDDDVYPELKDRFVFGTYRGDLYAFQVDKAKGNLVEELRIKTAIYPSLEVVAVAVSPTGELYFGAYDIMKLKSIDESSKVAVAHTVSVNSTGNVQVPAIEYNQYAKTISINFMADGSTAQLSAKIPDLMMADGAGNSSAGKIKNVTLQYSGDNGSAQQLPPHDIKTSHAANSTVVQVQINPSTPPADAKLRLLLQY